jgi:hypothetical protein
VALLPCVAGHGVRHALEDRIQKLPRLLWVAAGEQLQRALQVRKQHRDLLALGGGFGGEDLLGQMTRGVAER